jgi:hypothetical protein
MFKFLELVSGFKCEHSLAYDNNKDMQRTLIFLIYCFTSYKRERNMEIVSIINECKEVIFWVQD